MKAHQIANRIFLLSGTVSILFAIILEWRIDATILRLMSVFSGHREFLINILLGLSGGCLVATITESIFLRTLKKSKIQEILLQVRHIKSASNRFYSVDKQEKFLDICSEIENHFVLIQQNLDVLEISFKENDDLQKMFNTLSEYVGRISGAKYRVRYGENTFEYENNGICSVGELNLAECLSMWYPLVKRLDGETTLHNYCELDDAEISIQQLKAKSIKELVKEVNANG